MDAFSQLQRRLTAKPSICTHINLGAIARLYKREFFTDA
jgi:hypothetical protein